MLESYTIFSWCQYIFFKIFIVTHYFSHTNWVREIPDPAHRRTHERQFRKTFRSGPPPEPPDFFSGLSVRACRVSPLSRRPARRWGLVMAPTRLPAYAHPLRAPGHFRPPAAPPQPARSAPQAAQSIAAKIFFTSVCSNMYSRNKWNCSVQLSAISSSSVNDRLLNA